MNETLAGNHSGVQTFYLLRFCMFCKLLVKSTLVDGNSWGLLVRSHPSKVIKHPILCHLYFPPRGFWKVIAAVETTFQVFG